MSALKSSSHLFPTITADHWRAALQRNETNNVSEQIKAMTTETKTKKVKRFRAKIGERYAALDFNLHEKGVLVPTDSVIGAAVFKRNVDVGTAMERTRVLQGHIRQSMHAGWSKLKALDYRETPTVEEFEVVDDEVGQ